MSNSGHHPVLFLVSRHAKFGQESEFEIRMTDFITRVEAFPGCIGAQIVHPGDGDDVEVEDTLYHALMAFDSSASLQAWQNSPERAAGLASIAPYIKGNATVRGISGLANWFQPQNNNRQSQPPRWKVAVVTWLGIFPTVYLLFRLLADLLAPLPLLSRIAILTILVVVIMTWGVAPQLTRLFRTWLYPSLSSSK